MKDTWIQVPSSCRFVNIGVDFYGEIAFFRIIIVDDHGLLGFMVIDPDGIILSEIAVENEEVVNEDFSFEGREFSLQLLLANNSYEIMFNEQ